MTRLHEDAEMERDKLLQNIATNGRLIAVMIFAAGIASQHWLVVILSIMIVCAGYLADVLGLFGKPAIGAVMGVMSIALTVWAIGGLSLSLIF